MCVTRLVLSIFLPVVLLQKLYYFIEILENFIDGMHFHYFSTMKDAVNFNFGK